MNNDIIIDIIEPDGLLYIILHCLGVNISSVDFSTPLGISLIVIAVVFVLSLVFFIIKALTCLVRSGRY